MRLASLRPSAATLPASLPFPRVLASRYALAGLTLLAFALRLPLLDRFPLREDEALYSFWALHFRHGDPLFLHVWPDKPPLFLWLLAGIFELLGVSQASARWLNIAFSTLTIPVVAALAGRMWGRRSALVAALVMSLSPFAISFAPTAYTDPLLVLAGNLALLMAFSRRSLWAGLWLGVAIMSKQQGLLYLPLVIALLQCGVGGSAGAPGAPAPLGAACGVRSRPASALRILLLFCVGLAAIILPILYWDSLRWTVAPSPWDLSVRNYGPLALAPWHEWIPRLRSWSLLLWQLTASWPLWTAMVILAIARLGQAFWPQQQLDHAAPIRTPHNTPLEFALATPHWPSRTRRSSLFTAHSSLLTPHCSLILTLWTAGFLLLHIVTTVQIWDRYLLPLAPLVALAVAGLAVPWLQTAMPTRAILALCLILVLAWPPAIQAAQGQLPIGGDHGAYAGLTDALAWVRQRSADGVTLYHHVLSAQYRFYLFDEVESGRYDLRWFPSAVYLADNASKAPQRLRLLIEPDWSPVRSLAQHLAMRNLELVRDAQFGHFTVFEIRDRQSPLCNWCLCRPQTHFLPLLPGDQGSLLRRSQLRGAHE